MCHDGKIEKLIFFEIEFDRLEELLTKSRKEQESAMVVFLTQIDIFLKVSGPNLEFAASKVMLRECKKGEMIL